jgi:glycerophosphoryl diester phosphodiesterase
LFPELTMNVPLVQLIADNAWGETQTRGENGEWRNYDFSWMHSSEGMRDLARTVVGVGPAWTMLLPGVSSQEVLAGKAWVGRAHNAGLKVHPYTFRKEPDQWPVGVTSFESMLDLFFNTLNVDGVFTDYPDLARDFLQR